MSFSTRGAEWEKAAALRQKDCETLLELIDKAGRPERLTSDVEDLVGDFEATLKKWAEQAVEKLFNLFGLGRDAQAVLKGPRGIFNRIIVRTAIKLTEDVLGHIVESFARYINPKLERTIYNRTKNKVLKEIIKWMNDGERYNEAQALKWSQSLSVHQQVKRKGFIVTQAVDADPHDDEARFDAGIKHFEPDTFDERLQYTAPTIADGEYTRDPGTDVGIL